MCETGIDDAFGAFGINACFLSDGENHFHNIVQKIGTSHDCFFNGYISRVQEGKVFAYDQNSLLICRPQIDGILPVLGVIGIRSQTRKCRHIFR